MNLNQMIISGVKNELYPLSCAKRIYFRNLIYLQMASASVPLKSDIHIILFTSKSIKNTERSDSITISG